MQSIADAIVKRLAGDVGNLTFPSPEEMRTFQKACADDLNRSFEGDPLRPDENCLDILMVNLLICNFLTTKKIHEWRVIVNQNTYGVENGFCKSIFSFLKGISGRYRK